MKPPTGRGSGKFPEFGAIFLSNTETRRECFTRYVFALPRTSAQFVRKVRAGMLLFLFDYQKRQMYGVFEAVSDGGINVVPHAYTSSGTSFPAQVRFRIIWKCSPLREHEFRYAIRDNYYTEHKFNFGLCKDQVRRLLCLFESRVRIQKSPTERKIRRSDRLIEKMSVGISSCEPLEPGEFRPSFSPRSSGSPSPQSSSVRSKDQGFPEHFPKVKGLYSDRIEERKSVFPRPRESAKYTTDETKGTTADLDRNANVYRCKDLEIKRSYADVKPMKEIMGNLLRRQKSWMKNQIGRNHVSRKREAPTANIFCRSNFNSGSNKQEKETFKEKGQKRNRAGCDKYYGRGGYDKYDGRPEAIPVDSTKHMLFSRGMQEEKPILNVKTEGKTDREIGGKRCDCSPVSSCLSDMQQKKRKLVFPIPSAELENAGVSESYLDDQVESCENYVESNKSESFQLSPSNMPSKFDAKKYLENIRDQNQFQEKCEEIDTSLSWESGLIEIIDNYKQFLEEMATMVSCLVVDDDNSEDNMRNIEDKVEK